jgi:hypothetical protein
MTRPVASSAQAVTQAAGALTKEQRDRMTPAQVIDELKKGWSARCTTCPPAPRSFSVKRSLA